MKRYSFPLLWLLLSTTNTLAQQAFYGSFVGNVSDPSGAAVPDAAVTVTHLGTNVAVEVQTNAQGLYQALNLNTGTYRVSASKQGFQTFTRQDIELRAGQQVRVDVQLTVGEISQTIEVKAGAPLLNTETATTSITGLFEHRNTVTLPNAGSITNVFPDIYYQLLFGQADINNSAFVIGGTLSGQNAEVQDGMRIEGQRHYVGGNRGLARPGIESVEEVVVTTTSPSAKYPNPSAIETVMKAGTNDWHGSLMYIHGNKSLNAPQYYTHAKTPFILHQYFGSIGGPIRKQKTFFFFGQQGFYFPNGEESFSNLPTARMKSGDLGEFLDPNFLRGSAPIPIRDPATGQPFPNNVIPADRISPIARKMLESFPNPNRPSDSTGPSYNRNYLLTDLLIRKETFDFDTRVDHYWTPKQHTYVRFSLFDSPNARTQFNLPGFGGNYFIVKTKILTVHHTSTLSANLVNHLMVGIFNEDDPLGAGDFRDASAEPAWNQILGIPGIPANQDSGFPYVTFQQTAMTTPLSYGFGNYKNRYTHIRDDVSWNHSRHNLQFGFDFRHESEGSGMPGVGQTSASSCQFGCLNFNGRWTGLDFADFLLGFPFTTARFYLLPPDTRFRNEWSGYIQDDIKWSPKLSVSLGMRYDYFPIVRSENDFATLFDPVSSRLIVPSQEALGSIRPEVPVPVPIVTAATAGFSESLLNSDRNGWGPRAGIAYRLLNDTVVRGGFGLYHTPLTSSGRRLLTGPFQAREDFPVAQPGPNDPPILTLSNPYVGSGRGTSLVNFFAGEPDTQNPLHYNYNLAVEHQIGNNALIAEFVGKKSIIPWTPNLNTIAPSLIPFSVSRRPFPQLGTVTGLPKGAQYNYHALRLNAKRRFSAGLFFDVAYVWSKTIDDLGGISGEAGGGSEDPFNRLRDRGLSSFMPPHRLTLSYLWELPFGKSGKRLAFENQGFGKVMNFIVGGWETAGTYNFQTAAPLTPSGRFLNDQGLQYDAPNTNTTAGRPDYTGAPLEASSDQVSQGFVFNPNAFTEHVPSGRYGNTGRGVLPFGEGSIAINQSFFRNFQVPWFSENGAKLRFGVLMYNAINHANVSNPIVALNNPLYGKRMTDKVSGQTRTIGFQARLDF